MSPENWIVFEVTPSTVIVKYRPREMLYKHSLAILLVRIRILKPPNQFRLPLGVALQ